MDQRYLKESLTRHKSRPRAEEAEERPHMIPGDNKEASEQEGKRKMLESEFNRCLVLSFAKTENTHRTWSQS